MPVPFKAESPQWQQLAEAEQESLTETMNEEKSHLPGTSEEVHESIRVSNDNLFFIQYAAVGTFRPRWYLFRVASKQVTMAPSVKCAIYTVDFLAKHVNDEDLIDPDARWWPEWHEYEIIADGIPEFGRRIFFSPRARPNLDKFTFM
jgi:hypothetical protein